MKRTWTIIGVADVTRSIHWYQSLFGQPRSAPAHDYFGQLLDTDGTVLLCLHRWGDHEHPTLMSPDRAGPRALNPATGTLEFALRDPDGYYVMVSALN